MDPLAALVCCTRKTPMRRSTPWLLCLLLLAPAADASKRSRALRAEFQRLTPCPATGQAQGPCPGYQADHRQALICGGRDELPNLQWLTIEEHKAKTRAEVALCRPRDRRHQQKASLAV